MADKEITKLLAEFMGWTFKAIGEFKFWGVLADPGIFDRNEWEVVKSIDEWNPLENISDAMELWDKLIEKDYTLTMSEYRKDSMVIIYIGNGLVEAPTKQRAICMAVLKAVENGDESHG